MNKTQIQKIFSEYKLDVIISTSEQTRLWYTKINTSAGFLFIEAQQNKKNSTLIIDGRYIETAKKSAQNVRVKLLKQNTLKDFAHKKRQKYRVIGLEKEYLTLGEHEKFTKLFPYAQFILFSGQSLRIIKSVEEIQLMKKAGEISLKALNKLKRFIKPGITEKALDIKLETYLRELGADKSSFDAIIASGHRSSLPHGRASSKTLENGELVTIDFGAYFKGYAADITRTFHVGKVTDKKLLEIEKIVTQAQQLGIKAIKPGITTGEIDKICRDYIEKMGYGKYFVHSTGHGLGIDVHELPYVAKQNKTVLKPGMVITVEPGIYIPNFGGIRLEDDILVTNDGHEILSSL